MLCVIKYTINPAAKHIIRRGGGHNQIFTAEITDIYYRYLLRTAGAGDGGGVAKHVIRR
jgi:hypothetical protein